MQHPPPDLDDRTVAGCVREAWGLPVHEATYWPVGFGSHHWRLVDASGGSWFATADDVSGPGGPAALEGAFSVAATAQEVGVRGVHAPSPQLAGGLVLPVGERYALSVQPWLDGASGRFGDRWDEGRALALVDLLIGVHGIPVGRVGAPVEDAAVPGLADLVVVLDAVRSGRAPRVDGAQVGGGPFRPVVLGALRRHATAVGRAVASVGEAGVTGGDLVPTHGEPHPGNVVLTPGGPVLVDWETARLAEPERDLWLVAARTDLDVVALYSQRSGRVVDPARLRARALRWALADVADYVPTLLAAQQETPDTTWQLHALLGTLDEL